MKKFILIVLIISLVGIGIVFIRNSQVSDKDTTVIPQTEVPPVQITEQIKENTDKEHLPKPIHSQMDFTPEQSSVQSSSEQYDESISRKRREYRITPGVSFVPGTGLTMKLPGTEENIQIRRDNTYRSGEYRVQWQKKF